MAFRKVTNADEAWEYYEAGLLYEQMMKDGAIVPAFGWSRINMALWIQRDDPTVTLYISVEE